MKNSLVVAPVKEIRGLAGSRKPRGNILHYPDALREKRGRESQDNGVNNFAAFRNGKHVHFPLSVAGKKCRDSEKYTVFVTFDITLINAR